MGKSLFWLQFWEKLRDMYDLSLISFGLVLFLRFLRELFWLRSSFRISRIIEGSTLNLLKWKNNYLNSRGPIYKICPDSVLLFVLMKKNVQSSFLNSTLLYI